MIMKKHAEKSLEELNKEVLIYSLGNYNLRSSFE